MQACIEAIQNHTKASSIAHYVASRLPGDNNSSNIFLMKIYFEKEHILCLISGGADQIMAAEGGQLLTESYLEAKPGDPMAEQYHSVAAKYLSLIHI